ncbi:MAG: hypothetical protein AAF614_04330 [Chloroflexota bacterium]
MLKQLKQILIVAVFFLLAACTPTTAVPEPTMQILPTKSAALRAVVAEAVAAEAVANAEAEVEVIEASSDAEELIVEADAPEARSVAETEVEAVDAELMKKLELELSGAVIVYRRSGGFAGVNEEWRIYENGRVVDIDGNEWQLAPEQVTSLITVTQTLGFNDMRTNYVPQGYCCDHFMYDLIVNQGDRIHRVTTADGVSGVPEALGELLAATTVLIETVEK